MYTFKKAFNIGNKLIDSQDKLDKIVINQKDEVGMHLIDKGFIVPNNKKAKVSDNK